jgi:enoyl-CoA hydratase
VNTDYIDVLFRVKRGLGWITLNRPRTINALDHRMVRHVDAQLAEWADDDQVCGIVLTGAGTRGLCAGGDVVSIYYDARTGGSASVEFWRDEYVMNGRIASYPKPYLAVMNGIVMGGGVGISAHGNIRLVTDHSRIAMPETRIGLCPDVGAGWLIARAPGELGTHMALTGEHFGAGDAIAAGLADHYLPAHRVESFLTQLTGDSIATAVTALTWVAPASPLLREKAWIDACYSADTVTEILDRLHSRTEPGAARAAERITMNSPIAVSVTLRALRQARRLPTLRDVLDQDLRISTAALDSHDLVEGIRAQLVDKDHQPHWSPPTVADISPDMIDRYFGNCTMPPCQQRRL